MGCKISQIAIAIVNKNINARGDTLLYLRLCYRAIIKKQHIMVQKQAIDQGRTQK
jgi:hypothetical protein